jgi:2-polyprenyl-3-methyl-5-hydroxy-6-metoxy-1,4-benzoquinol methylase
MKSDDQRAHWDLKYEQGLPSLEKPDPFFVSAFEEFVADQFPNGGTALDLAGGIGRHALWLAKKNWAVTVVDISEVAVRKLGQKARELDLDLNLFALDALAYPFEVAKFDLIVVFYHFDRALCARLLSALKPRGFVICKTSLIWDSYEGQAPANLRPLAKSEVLALFPTLQVKVHQERPVRDRGVVEYVGMRRGSVGEPQ